MDGVGQEGEGLVDGRAGRLAGERCLFSWPPLIINIMHAPHTCRTSF